MNINIGDEITLCGTVLGHCLMGLDGVQGVYIRTKNGNIVMGIPVNDIKTIHPYKEPTKEDMRKGINRLI